jgi:sulfatase modifying factor 1
MKRVAESRGYRSATMLVLLGVVGTAGACDESDEPAQGGLLVVIETELSLPKDLDHVRLHVSQFGRVLAEEEHAVGPDDLRLPASFRVAAPENPSPVLIRGVGSKDGKPRIQRDAVTPIPQSYLGRIRLPLNYLCDGTAESDGSSTCPADEETCILGACAPSVVPSSLLTPEGEAGSGDGPGDPASVRCFDVVACFADPIQAELELEDCSTVLPADTDERLLNVALRPHDDQPGVCDGSSCWNVLNRGRDGYRVDRRRVLLPEGVCESRARLGFDVFLSTACLSKTLASPVCGPWSPVTEPIEQPAPPPGVGSACSGPTSQACGACGTRTRSCENGTWSSFGECGGQLACEPDSSEACGVGGVRGCGGNCEWGRCSDQRCVGPASRACGNCGTQRRSCAGEVWSDWSPCENGGVCRLNAVEACSDGGIRTCAGNCEWSACSDAACDGPAAEACGTCGTRLRTCFDGVWSDWSECEAQGECSPNSTEACGQDGTRTCGGNCAWSECTGQLCDGLPTQSCGNCGTRSRVCENGVWSEWSECEGEGECRPDISWSCGNRGTMVCNGRCTFGPCSNQACTGAPRRDCGNCGAQSRACDNGNWSDWSACTDQGDCEPTTTRACSDEGRQTCGNDCVWGDCTVESPGEGGRGGATDGGSSGVSGATDGGSSAGGDAGGSGGSSGAGPSGGDNGCPSAGGEMVRVPEDYCVDSTEVTRGTYEAWRTSSGVLTSHASCAWKVGVINAAAAGAEGLPAVSIDWCDAVSFCEGMGKRLCGRIGGGANSQADVFDSTLSQWFNACSSHEQYDYQYGDTFDSTACNAAGGVGEVIEPASRETCQSPDLAYAGIFDLSGNVWEWEDSCAAAGQSAACWIRGGDWLSGVDSACGVSSQARSTRGAQTGFRCCAD